MRWCHALSIVALAGCNLFSDSHDAPDPLDAPAALPDAAVDECGFVDCGPDRHCEAQCAPPGTDGCTVACHVTCVPDASCDQIDCGPTRTCVEHCSHDCTGFAWLCQQSCDVPSDACETLATEAACAVRADCIPIYRGESCTCTGDTCSCLVPDETFERCRTL